MSFTIARGNWHGFSLEDAALGLTAVVVAVVLARAFGRPMARDRAPDPADQGSGDADAETGHEPPR
jgi:hypothetical protein